MIVRSPQEILSTLDAAGTLDGLPFMAEMLDSCGKAFRVERRAEKTCVDVSLTPSVYSNRRFPANDVVFLEGPRCDGEGHDGCGRACKIFWKETWLRPFDSADASTETSQDGRDELRGRLKKKSDANHYYCQSTQLCEATAEFPGNKKLWRFRIMLREIRNGDRSVPELLKLLTIWSWQRFLRKIHCDEWLRGPHQRAPAASLGLAPGDPVRIKSRAEMVATLDHERRNRGLGICYEMTRYCGAHAEVRSRLNRMIDERTGEMRDIRDT
ncbi:MAG: hypothetical protein LC749_10385, partial [Actinobacteria bacterium]|nr:hypothetical protein [Actinomycetota bacterium]